MNNGTEFFSTQYQVEFLNPPYMLFERPALAKLPAQIHFNQKFTTSVNIPAGLRASEIQIILLRALHTHSDLLPSAVSLMDLGLSLHTFHSSARLVSLKHTLSADHKALTMTAPPNNRIYPRGPAFLFLTINDVTSEGVRVMVGDGRKPPVKDQGGAPA